MCLSLDSLGCKGYWLLGCLSLVCYLYFNCFLYFIVTYCIGCVLFVWLTLLSTLVVRVLWFL